MTFRELLFASAGMDDQATVRVIRYQDWISDDPNNPNRPVDIHDLVEQNGEILVLIDAIPPE